MERVTPRRLRRLERVADGAELVRRADALGAELGCQAAELLADLRRSRVFMLRWQVLHGRLDGLIDLEPYLRASAYDLAAAHDLDPAEVLAEAERIAAEWSK